MSKNRFFISDPHYGHEKTCTVFKRADGTPLRPFKDAEEMNEEMVKRHNAVVKPNDVVYYLGDIAINRRYLPILNRLNGEKRLTYGNHDIFDHSDYLKYFTQLSGVIKVGHLWCTHVPCHLDSIPRWAIANVHGHIHANLVMRKDKYSKELIPDSRYLNVCVEHTDYTPISLEDLEKRIKDYQAKYPVDQDEDNAILRHK